MSPIENLIESFVQHEWALIQQIDALTIERRETRQALREVQRSLKRLRKGQAPLPGMDGPPESQPQDEAPEAPIEKTSAPQPRSRRKHEEST